MENIDFLSIITPQVLKFLERVMSNSLHNKIYLGRGSMLASRRLRMVLGAGVLAGVGLVLLSLYSFR